MELALDCVYASTQPEQLEHLSTVYTFLPIRNPDKEQLSEKYKLLQDRIDVLNDHLAAAELLQK